MAQLSRLKLLKLPTSSGDGDLTFLLVPGHLTGVDGGPEAPDVVPVDAEMGENLWFVVEVAQQPRTSQLTLSLHNLHRDSF